MKKIAEQKGITLIALIITIIVMLILVGVTINVAMQGGLFETTRNAANKTEKEAEKESLIAIATGAYDAISGTVDKSKLETNLADWEVTGEGPYDCTSPNGNKFTVTTNGEVKDYKDPSFLYGTYYKYGNKANSSIYLGENVYSMFEEMENISSVQLLEQNTVNISYGEKSEDAVQVKYIATENNVLLNLDDMTFIKSNDGIIYDLSGEYTSSDELKKYVFTEGTGKVYEYNRNSADDSWVAYTGSNAYASLAGRYFWDDGQEMVFSNGYKTFTYDGVTYTNESASTDSPTGATEEITPTDEKFIYGVYYGLRKESCIEIQEKTIKYGWYTNFDSLSIDEQSKTMILTLSDDDGDVERGIFNYLQIGNDIILYGEPMDNSIYASSEEAFANMNLDLSGDYLNSAGNAKLSFTASSPEVIGYNGFGENWTVNTGNLGGLSYFKFDGKYIWSTGEEMKIDSNGSITLNNVTYSRVQ